MHTVLITGSAGFIGFHLAQRLLNDGLKIIGLDNLNPYYSVQLKRDRLRQLESQRDFIFIQADIADFSSLAELFARYRPGRVINLAAQVGVRYSLSRPLDYVRSNMVGFANILECCRQFAVRHLIYASSSSVYGGNEKTPFSEGDRIDRPLNIYAASKISNELMAHAYGHLFSLPTTGLRFFTVYGPWGRPDMAPILFAEAIIKGRPIPVFHHGRMRRDFTYIDDIVEGMVRLLKQAPPGNPPCARIYNIGHGQPLDLLTFINTLEKHLERKAVMEFKPYNKEEMLDTAADVEGLVQATGFRPATSLDAGIAKFVRWYKDYYAGPALSAPFLAGPAADAARRAR